jgi:hypothetical protein
MMDNKYQETVLVGDHHQKRAEKWPLREVEESLRFNTRPGKRLGLSFLRGLLPQVEHR